MRRGRSPDRGASTVEYGALAVLVAVILVVLVAAVPGPVDLGLRSAICQVFKGDCVRPAGQVAAGPTPTLLGPPPSPGQGNQQQPGVPSPLPGPPPPVPPPPPPPPKEQTDTEAALNETPLGKEALKWVKDHDVKVVYRAGGGSYYSDDDNTFYVDTNATPEERAATFVHETNHAENKGKPNPREMDRDDYVKAAVDEEVNGTVLQIQANQQLQDKRGKGNVGNTVFQQEYEDAYNKAVSEENGERRKLHRPPLTPEQAKRLGEAAGRQRIEDAFNNGEVTTSTTGEKYPDYYGHGWDDNHSCFLWVFC